MVCIGLLLAQKPLTPCARYGRGLQISQMTVLGKGCQMPKEEWGVKRICPTTGRRFYDLGKTPIISPYTGEVVVFDANTRTRVAAAEKPKVVEADTDDAVEDEDDLLIDDDDTDVEADDALLEDDDDDDEVSLDDIADVASDDD